MQPQMFEDQEQLLRIVIVTVCILVAFVLFIYMLAESKMPTIKSKGSLNPNDKQLHRKKGSAALKYSSSSSAASSDAETATTSYSGAKGEVK